MEWTTNDSEMISIYNSYRSHFELQQIGATACFSGLPSCIGISSGCIYYLSLWIRHFDFTHDIFRSPRQTIVTLTKFDGMDFTIDRPPVNTAANTVYNDLLYILN